MKKQIIHRGTNKAEAEKIKDANPGSILIEGKQPVPKNGWDIFNSIAIYTVYA